MESIFGQAELVGTARITRKDGTVETVDISDAIKQDPTLIERLKAYFKKEN